MNTSLWQKMKPIFYHALELQGDEREQYLIKACGDDAELRTEIDKLFNCEECDIGFMTSNALDEAVLFTDDHINSQAHNHSADQAALSKLIGTTFDKQYHIEALIGKGGMGAVFRAKHLLLDRTVAIKVMSPHIVNDQKFRALFLQEGKAATRFHHNNIVTVHDLRETDDGQIYLVQDYLSGTTLKAALKQHGKYSPQATLAILAPIADALDEAHRHNVIHCDLKPDNIIICDDEAHTIKLLDLGLARILYQEQHQERIDNNNLLLGTPSYMAPEQWQKDKQLDGRVDLYSLAIICYEMIAGEKPFIENGNTSIAYQQVALLPKPLHKMDDNIPKAFSRILMTGLSKQPANRPVSCKRFIDDLKQTLIKKDPLQPLKSKRLLFYAANLFIGLFIGLVFSVVIMGAILAFMKHKTDAPNSNQKNNSIAIASPTTIRPSIKANNESGDLSWIESSRLFRNELTKIYYAGTGKFQSIIKEHSNTEIDIANYRLKLLLDNSQADNSQAVFGEIEINYHFDLKLHSNNSSDDEAVLHLINNEQDLIRKYSVVGKRNSNEILLEVLIADKTIPFDLIFRTDRRVNNGQLIMRRIQKVPFSPLPKKFLLPQNSQASPIIYHTQNGDQEYQLQLQQTNNIGEIEITPAMRAAIAQK